MRENAESNFKALANNLTSDIDFAIERSLLLIEMDITVTWTNTVVASLSLSFPVIFSTARATNVFPNALKENSFISSGVPRLMCR